MSKPQRTRGRKLMALRHRVMQSQPLCQECARNGRVTMGVELDHVLPISRGGTDARGNLEMLCRDCHRVKTARDFGRTSPAGCDERGYPTGPHAWNR